MLHSHSLPQWPPERRPTLQIQYSCSVQIYILCSSSTKSCGRSSWQFHLVMALISRERVILSYLPLILSPSDAAGAYPIPPDSVCVCVCVGCARADALMTLEQMSQKFTCL